MRGCLASPAQSIEYSSVASEGTLRQAEPPSDPVRPPRSRRSKVLILTGALFLGLVGYTLAPPDLAPGAYRTEIRVTFPDAVLTLEHPFQLGDTSGTPVTRIRSEGRYRLSFQGPSAHRYGLGERITFRVRITEADGTPLRVATKSATATVTGPGYRQELPPTERSEDWLIWSMRVPYRAGILTGLVFFVATLWLTEVVPLAAAALFVPFAVVVSGVTDPSTVLAPFFHPIIVLFLAGFLMAEAMRRTELDRLVALTVLRHASLRPALLMLTMMAITAFLSMWMSNTASIAIVLPIALAVLERLPKELRRMGFRRALVLGVAYAGTIGGVGSAIGTPANILAITFLNELTDNVLTFADWFSFGVPMVLAMVPITWLYLSLTFRLRISSLGPSVTHEIYRRDLRAMGPIRPDQALILLIFVVVMGLWLTKRFHGIHTAIVALGGALALFLVGLIRQQDLNRINWGALLTFGGGLALGTMLVATGVSDWVALQMVGLAEQPALLVVFIVGGLTLTIGAFVSNTAAAAMLIPLAVPLAQILGMDPRLLVGVVAIATSIDFALVVGTPPTMMAYSTGLLSAPEIFRRGVVLDLIGILVLTLGVVWIWSLLGVVTL